MQENGQNGWFDWTDSSIPMNPSSEPIVLENTVSVKPEEISTNELKSLLTSLQESVKDDNQKEKGRKNGPREAVTLLQETTEEFWETPEDAAETCRLIWSDIYNEQTDDPKKFQEKRFIEESAWIHAKANRLVAKPPSSKASFDLPKGHSLRAIGIGSTHAVVLTGNFSRYALDECQDEKKRLEKLQLKRQTELLEWTFKLIDESEDLAGVNSSVADFRAQLERDASLSGRLYAVVTDRAKSRKRALLESGDHGYTPEQKEIVIGDFQTPKDYVRPINTHRIPPCCVVYPLEKSKARTVGCNGSKTVPVFVCPAEYSDVKQDIGSMAQADTGDTKPATEKTSQARVYTRPISRQYFPHWTPENRDPQVVDVSWVLRKTKIPIHSSIHYVVFEKELCVANGATGIVDVYALPSVKLVDRYAYDADAYGKGGRPVTVQVKKTRLLVVTDSGVCIVFYRDDLSVCKVVHTEYRFLSSVQVTAATLDQRHEDWLWIGSSAGTIMCYDLSTEEPNPKVIPGYLAVEHPVPPKMYSHGRFISVVYPGGVQRMELSPLAGEFMHEFHARGPGSSNWKFVAPFAWEQYGAVVVAMSRNGMLYVANSNVSKAMILIQPEPGIFRAMTVKKTENDPETGKSKESVRINYVADPREDSFMRLENDRIVVLYRDGTIMVHNVEVRKALLEDEE